MLEVSQVSCFHLASAVVAGALLLLLALEAEEEAAAAVRSLLLYVCALSVIPLCANGVGQQDVVSRLCHVELSESAIGGRRCLNSKRCVSKCHAYVVVVFLQYIKWSCSS